MCGQFKPLRHNITGLRGDVSYMNTWGQVTAPYTIEPITNIPNIIGMIRCEYFLIIVV